MSTKEDSAADLPCCDCMDEGFEAGLIESAWGLIANSYAWHNPDAASPGWRDAAIRWREQYHAYIGANPPEVDIICVPDLTQLIREMDL